MSDEQKYVSHYEVPGKDQLVYTLFAPVLIAVAIYFVLPGLSGVIVNANFAQALLFGAIAFIAFALLLVASGLATACTMLLPKVVSFLVLATLGLASTVCAPWLAITIFAKIAPGALVFASNTAMNYAIAVLVGTKLLSAIIIAQIAPNAFIYALDWVGQRVIK